MKALISHTVFLPALMGAAASVDIVVACSFCAPVTGRTMLTDLDAADVAFVAELDSPTPTPANPNVFDLLNRDRQKGKAELCVRKVLKGELDAEGTRAITVPLRIPDARGTLHLITCDNAAGLWRNYRLSDDGLKFALGAATLPALAADSPSSMSVGHRLEYCLRFLGTSDFQLRKAVFAEFSRAPYASLQRLKARLDRERVHEWMLPASGRAEEARLIFMLLSICGDSTDVQMLRQEFRQCIASNWAGTLDGVVLAYVSLGGLPALEDVDQKLLLPGTPAIELKQAAAQALRFLVDHGTSVARPRLLLSYRLLLRQPETADLVIQDLARWENWHWNVRTAE